MTTEEFYQLACRGNLWEYRSLFRCTPGQREEISCTREFYDRGFFQNGRYDEAAQYEAKCHACPCFPREWGIYFGNGKYTRDFEAKEVFRAEVSTEAELAELTQRLPSRTRALWLQIRPGTNLSPLEHLTGLEVLCLNVSPRDVLWNFAKTSRLQVLELLVGSRGFDLSPLAQAKSLRHLGLFASLSQSTDTKFPSLAPLSKLSGLTSLSLSGVTGEEGNLDALIAIPNLRRLWISPRSFPMEAYAKFEALKFRIGEEYGIYCEDESWPLGKGKRAFATPAAREKFLAEYRALMDQFCEA